MLNLTPKELFVVATNLEAKLDTRLKAREQLRLKAKTSKKSVAKLLTLSPEELEQWDQVCEINYTHEEIAKSEAYLPTEPVAQEAPMGLNFIDDEQHALDSAHIGDEADPLEEETPAKPAKVTKPIIDAQVEGKALPKNSRGLITLEVKRLLQQTEMTYAHIVEAVVAKYPEAKTTTRSVASVASDMRKANEPVAIRRVPAK